MTLWQCCTQYASKFGKLGKWPQDWKRSVFIPIPKRGNAKECSNYHTIALISHASKVMLKILQARLQQYVNQELPDVQAGFKKGRGTRDQIANICWIIEKARQFQRNIYFCFIDYPKAFDCVDHNKLWKVLQDMGIPDSREPARDIPLVTKVLRKEARHTQRRDRASGVPLDILEHLPPINQSLPTLLLCALSSDFTGGCPPPPSHSLCQRANLQPQLIKFLGN